jgi:hypothetical protein
MSAASDQEAKPEQSAYRSEQGESPVASVTSRRTGGTPAAERKRQQRARERQHALRFERQDWSLFLDPATLPQKAGCQPRNLRQLVVRELVDNALDAGAKATLQMDGVGWIVADDGPGIAPADVPRLFAVRRPLLSSKLIRLPLRGMLGNGLRVVVGAVAASQGSLVVETRGRRLVLAVDCATGTTIVTDDQPIPPTPGLVVRITLGPALPSYTGRDDKLAREAIHIASYGNNYVGPSSPWWYSPKNLHQLMQLVTPTNTTVAALGQALGFNIDDARVARDLDLDAAGEILKKLRESSAPVLPDKLGAIGPGAYTWRGDELSYARRTGFTRERDTEIPYVAECWAHCIRSEHRGDCSARASLLLNRTPSSAIIHPTSGYGTLILNTCGMHREVTAHAGDYDVTISIITPYIELATDGKEPSLSPFGDGIAAVVEKACKAAHRAMEKPAGKMSIKDAAWQVMPDAYRRASTDGTLPANARQVMYAARGDILRRTGKESLNDHYFTQKLLPDYIEAHPDSTADWDVTFDQRGTFIEPHTGHIVPLSTVAVREYLGERPVPEAPAAVNSGRMAQTRGPENRYRNVLFVEKEGFNALLTHAELGERFDVAVTSTKGMTVVALRQLLDSLSKRGVEKVLVAHDFDLSGFSIFGTLAKSGRRYRYINNVQIIDIGLRLTDVREMDLEPEPYEPAGDWDARADTLNEHGAPRGDRFPSLAPRRT